MRDNQLTGSIPSELGNLTDLTILDLYGNQLSGPIPSELGSLTDLIYLYLGSNQLSGQIPVELGNLGDLQKLVLARNQLSGEMPAELGNLGNLWALALGRNQLTGNIPSELGNLGNLRNLGLSNNNLSGSVPTELTNLSNLERLNLSNNQLVDLPDFSNLSNFNYFDVSNNYFDFGDLQPNKDVLTSYSPQNPVRDGVKYENPIGTDITLSVDVEGIGNMYQWYFEGSSISSAMSSTLELLNIQQADMGLYYCKITNNDLPEVTLISLSDTIGSFINPPQFNAFAVNNNAIGLEWHSTIDLDSAIIQRSNDQQNFSEIGKVEGHNTHHDSDIALSNVYYYRVRGYKDGIPSFYSAIAQAQHDGVDYQYEKVLGDITGLDEPNVSYGGSWADINGDGFQDLAVANYTSFAQIPDKPLHHYLYINDGQGGFNRIVNQHPLLDTGSSRHIALIDYNNDGHTDFYAQTSPYPNELYMNEGDAKFQPISAFTSGFSTSSEQSSWADIDGDGDLDVFLGDTYVDGIHQCVWRNMGDGNFEPIASNIDEVVLGSSIWMGHWIDYDDDNDMDLFLPNSNGGTYLFQNDGNGSFQQITNSPITQDSMRVRGALWADFDNNGYLDLLLLSNQSSDHIFYFNNGGGNFDRQLSSDVLGEVNNFNIRVGTYADYDNDGWLDLILATFQERLVYKNNGDGTFTKVDNIIPDHQSGYYTGISVSDIDNDGDVDFFQTNNPFNSGGVYNILLKNNLSNGNNWLYVDLEGSVSNRDAIGARIRLVAGETTIYRWITSTTGLSAQNSLLEEFGLEKESMVDTIEVSWPSGINTILSDVSVNQILQITEKEPNEAPTDIALSSNTIDENLAIGTVVGVLGTT